MGFFIYSTVRLLLASLVSYAPCRKVSLLYGNIGLSNKFRIAIQAYDARGNIVWECELDIYGKVRNLHGEKTFIPFRFSGQYEDIETGLYYNRFRYYSPDTGTYISQDPIGLEGGNNFYAYVPDVNNDVDVFGLMPLSNPVNQGHHIVPHKAATDLGVRPFNSQTGVPSMYFDDSQFTGIEHSAMHGYNGIGRETKPLVKANQIQKAGMDNEAWLKSLERHYNNPALKDVRGDLHIINENGTKGRLIKKNVSAREAWELTKKWAKNQGFNVCK
ncbi:conserved hypothetical protein [Tenacibaculum maritimum]|uniref:RHS repeat domain-containing protein n=1 Tax=Tenacibaculum maritimum TaxID=107401 RepID=UPI0012E49E5E|nr:RHS repeat-associated core domain-containing protein [Tenacibaculum maritimum]CAA0227739.1 conserved hypothetical protein [Tenacibaculum maritimum]